ncbi:Beta-hexosaminidase [Propionibacterium freudenreichii subsp. shermanii]|nr:Beta-hexosaminidase [Propionibacterium freudenreichii subsp. shermanii]SPS09902.1 Beta-hexosaminidase [Propionibacterium freudenreichii subsp. shermanii]
MATNVAAVLAGVHAGGVVGAVKHFPGLGNVSANTDFGAAHDAVTTPDSDELNTFADVLAGADSVMVSSVVYDRIDPAGPAAFSSRVVSGLLREQLGYSRVIISDDLGAAVALADYPVAQRGTLFLRAGGDLALDVDPASVAAMVADTRAAVAADPDFAEQTVAKAARVLQLRADAGLGQCGA